MERRLRPIAPKPMPPPPLPLMPTGAAVSSVLWRARKRRREDHLLLSPPVSKREREAAASSYPNPGAGAGAAPMVATRGGRRYMPMPEGLLTGCEERLRRLSLVAGSPAAAALPWPAASPSSSDATRRAFPVERDLISKLQVPKVIRPRPARPLWTTICIDSSNIAAVGSGGVAYPETAAASASSKTAREVEAELELPGALPAVVSGHRNRVHLVNDAYKAMVGQPVCPWLDALPGAGASRRINGIVALDVRTFGHGPRLPKNAGSSDAFPCTARITWEHGGGKAIASLTVPCTVEHLSGGSGDYRFIWRFDSSRASIIYCIA